MEYNPLYDKGFKRVGCIGCPLATTRVKELNEYPQFKINYKKAFSRMIETRKAKGKDDKANWKDADGVYAWWVDDEQIPGQLTLDGTEYKP
jgi:phosphoadenosine phosphosulfate reductase